MACISRIAAVQHAVYLSGATRTTCVAPPKNKLRVEHDHEHGYASIERRRSSVGAPRSRAGSSSGCCSASRKAQERKARAMVREYLATPERRASGRSLGYGAAEIKSIRSQATAAAPRLAVTAFRTTMIRRRASQHAVCRRISIPTSRPSSGTMSGSWSSEASQSLSMCSAACCGASVCSVPSGSSVTMPSCFRRLSASPTSKSTSTLKVLCQVLLDRLVEVRRDRGCWPAPWPARCRAASPP